MKKEFYLDIDVTVSVQMYVRAESEEQAKEIAKKRIMDDTPYFVQKGYYVDMDVTNIEGEE